jgi:hypothetical protein
MKINKIITHKEYLKYLKLAMKEIVEWQKFIIALKKQYEKSNKK